MSARCCLSVLYAFSPQMSERWSLTIVKANLSFPLCYILCMPLVVCQSEIIASDSSSNLIHYYFIFIQDIFTAQFFAHVLTEFNTALGSCGCMHACFNLPIVRSQRQLILKHTLACTCIALFLGSLLCPRSTVHGEY